MVKLSCELECYLKCIFKKSKKRIQYVKWSDVKSNFKKLYPDINMSEMYFDLKNKYFIEVSKYMGDDRIRLTERGMEYCLSHFSYMYNIKNIIYKLVKFATRGV